MSGLDDLEANIEMAKLNNAMRYLEKPGSQMSPAEIASIGIRGNMLEVLGNSIVTMMMLEKHPAPEPKSDKELD